MVFRGSDVSDDTTHFSSDPGRVALSLRVLQTHIGTVDLPVSTIKSLVVSQYCRVSVSRLGHDVAFFAKSFEC